MYIRTENMFQMLNQQGLPTGKYIDQKIRLELYNEDDFGTNTPVLKKRKQKNKTQS